MEPMETAPKDRTIRAIVDGKERLVRWGKTSHVPMHGFCLADQGVEDFDLCEPTGWIPSAPLIGHPLTGQLLDLTSDTPIQGGCTGGDGECEVCQ